MKIRFVSRFVMVAAALAAFSGVAAPAFARPEAMTARLAAPVAEPTRIIAGTVVWNCQGDTCRASAERALNVRACRQLAREAGAVAAFGTATAALSAADLTSCNTAARARA